MLKNTNEEIIAENEEINLPKEQADMVSPIAKKSHKGKIIIIVSLFLVIALYVALLLYTLSIFNRTKSEGEKTDSNTQNATFSLANKIIKAETTDSSQYRLIHYDEYGKEVRHEGFSNDGVLDWYGIITYDDEGRMISWIDYDEKGGILNKSEYMYNLDGRKSKELCFDGDGNLWANIKYVYEGNTVTEIWCDKNWNPVGNYYIEYYESNKMLRKETYNRNGDVLEECAITRYDENGVKTETIEYDAGGKLVAVTKYTIVELSSNVTKE